MGRWRSAGPELDQRVGNRVPLLGRTKNSSVKRLQGQKKIKSRKTRAQNTQTRRCPRRRGSKPSPALETRALQLARTRTDLSPLECRILHNSPSITRTPSRPALRRVASGLFCFCGLRNSRQLLLARARLRLARKF